MGEEKGIWGAVAWQAGQAGVPLPLTGAARCVTERMQPWSIAVQRNMELWIAGNCWNVVLIWKISFIRLGRTRITKPRGYATISRWEQIEPVKHMIGPSANRKRCSPNPQFDFYTRYALFCPKHMSAHAWALISTPVLCEQLWSHLLTMKGFELSRCHYSFAFGLPVTRTTARMNTFLDHFVLGIKHCSTYVTALLCRLFVPLWLLASTLTRTQSWTYNAMLDPSRFSIMNLKNPDTDKSRMLLSTVPHQLVCTQLSSIFRLLHVTCSMCFCLPPLLSVPWQPDK